MTQRSAELNYNADYFAWQRPIGQFSAKANRFKFAPHIRSTDRVVDFGCGGGYLLAAIECGERRGVEVNASARAEAERNGVRTVAASADLPDSWADVIISNSVLEHCEHPLAELRTLFTKVKPGGKIVFGIWVETVQWNYTPNDINQHLYTWSPMSIGNLIASAGYTIESVTIHRIMWPPRISQQLYAVLGDRAFQAACKLYRFARVALAPVWPVDMTAGVVVTATRPAQ